MKKEYLLMSSNLSSLVILSKSLTKIESIISVMLERLEPDSSPVSLERRKIVTAKAIERIMKIIFATLFIRKNCRFPGSNPYIKSYQLSQPILNLSESPSSPFSPATTPSSSQKYAASIVMNPRFTLPPSVK